MARKLMRDASGVNWMLETEGNHKTYPHFFDLGSIIGLWRCEVKRTQIIQVAFSSLILLALACNLPGQLARNVGEKVEERIEDQLQEALEAAGNEELTEDLMGVAEEFSGQNLGELMDNFSGEDWSRADVPLPPDAKILTGYSGESEGDFILLETSMGIDEAEAWMLNKLRENGWSQGEMEVDMDLARVYDFAKGDENLGLVLNDNLLGDGTNISITIYR